jgi:hypothetical protein
MAKIKTTKNTNNDCKKKQKLSNTNPTKSQGVKSGSPQGLAVPVPL